MHPLSYVKTAERVGVGLGRAAAGRLKDLDDQLKGLKAKQADLTGQWNTEKDQMRSLQSIKEEIDRVNIEIQAAERDYDLNRAAELKYGTLLQLQKKLSETETQLETQVSILSTQLQISCIPKRCALGHLHGVSGMFCVKDLNVFHVLIPENESLLTPCSSCFGKPVMSSLYTE